MIQIKCGNCKMLCNIDEKSFSEQRNEQGYIFQRLSCISCGIEVPNALMRHILAAIDKKNFEDWEIGTFFEE